MKTTSIRAHGDRDYWDKVALLALRKRTSVAALVKDAVDRAYGDEIETAATLFLPANGAETHQFAPVELEVDHA